MNTAINTTINLPTYSPALKEYAWRNLIIEKRVSVNRLGKYFNKGVLGAFWSVLSSPVK